MTIGERIKNQRIKNNFTLDELAEKLNTTKQTIYKYENNIITNIPSDKIEMLASIFNVSPAYLMGWSENDFIVENRPSILTENLEENVKYLTENEDKSLLELYKQLAVDDKLVLLVKKASKLTPTEVTQMLKIIDTFVGDKQEIINKDDELK